MFRVSFRGVLAIAVLASSASAQVVLVVDDDPGPGVAFTDLALAVEAAPAGAILVVRDGTYSGFDVTRPMSVVADTAASVRITGPVSVRELPMGSSALLRGLTWQESAVDPIVELEVTDCLANVWLEDLDLTGGVEFGMKVRIAYSLGVRLVRCAVDASPADPQLFPLAGQSPALMLVSADVDAYACTFEGGDGLASSEIPPGIWVPGRPGEPAVEAYVGHLRLYDCTVRGGDGGDGVFFPSTAGGCIPAGDGGPAIEVSGLAAALVTSGTELIGGDPGAPGVRSFPGLSCPQSAHAGLAIEQSGGVVGSLWHLDLPAQLVTVALPAVVREDEPIVATLAGPPGAMVVWAVGTPPPLYSPDLVEPLGAVLQPFLFHFVTLDANGAGAVVYPPLGDVLPAGTGLVLHHQAARAPLFGFDLIAGGWSSNVLVDEAR